jgi:hypothetical protein
MTDETGRKWADYRPTKGAWFWSCVACAIATIVVGFTWGGWVTGGSAEAQAAQAREDGRAELAAAICVERFVSATDAAVQLAALKDESSWNRDRTLAAAGWATPLGSDKPVSGAAELCADQLVAMDLPVEQAVAN